ncbi:MAG: hypothetical protein JO006_18675 [Paucibacter sp.]|nr:hypothetical protein [Roseateles sp.]
MKNLSIATKMWLPIVGLVIVGLVIVVALMTTFSALRTRGLQAQSKLEQETQQTKFELALRWRSARPSAAKEIKTLIGDSVDSVDSVERVETGTRLVQDAANTMGETMGEIVASVGKVTEIIGEIRASAVEQSEGIGTFNSSVGELNQMTQQDAALVEQSAAAAELLREQAGKLARLVGGFKLQSAG